jgi:hypothetical protein
MTVHDPNAAPPGQIVDHSFEDGELFYLLADESAHSHWISASSVNANQGLSDAARSYWEYVNDLSILPDVSEANNDPRIAFSLPGNGKVLIGLEVEDHIHLVDFQELKIKLPATVLNYAMRAFDDPPSTVEAKPELLCF